MNSFWRKAISVFKYKIYIYIISFISSVYLARVLGPENKGILSTVTALVGMYVQFENLGMHSANTYYLSKDYRNSGKCLGNLIVLSFLSLVVNLFILIVILLNGEGNGLSPLLSICVTFMATISIFTMFQKNYFVAYGKIKEYNLLELIDTSGYFVLVLLVSLVCEIDATVVVFCLLFSNILVAGLSVIMERQGGIDVTFSFLFFKKSMKFGIMSYISCLASYILLKVDVLMISHFLGNYDVGIYSLAANLGEMYFMVSSSVSLILFPQLGELRNLNDKKIFMSKVYKVMIPVSLCIIMIMFVFSEYIVIFFYGQEYYDCIKILRTILPGVFFWSVSQYFYSFFSSEKFLLPTIIVPGIVCFMNIGMNYLFLPSLGSLGAGIATTISYTICCIGMIISYLVYIKVKEEKNKKYAK